MAFKTCSEDIRCCAVLRKRLSWDLEREPPLRRKCSMVRAVMWLRKDPNACFEVGKLMNMSSGRRWILITELLDGRADWSSRGVLSWALLEVEETVPNSMHVTFNYSPFSHLVC